MIFSFYDGVVVGDLAPEHDPRAANRHDGGGPLNRDFRRAAELQTFIEISVAAFGRDHPEVS
jgi:hypothetical protein